MCPIAREIVDWLMCTPATFRRYSHLSKSFAQERSSTSASNSLSALSASFGRLPSVLRTDEGGEQQVTPLELFFDLVYVFAVTQLSHLLLEHPTVGGALETLFLLPVVWWAWMYTMLWPKYTRIGADKGFNPPFWER
jgi:hypothetical protein